MAEQPQLDFYDKRILRRAQFLCKWAETNAPGNPVRIRACDPTWPYSYEETRNDTADWWMHWQDGDRAAQLRRDFEDAADDLDAEVELAEAKEAKRQAAAAAKARRERQVASIPSMNVAQLCSEIRVHATTAALEELVRRNAFPAAEISYIASRRAFIGMTEGGMLCAFGQPTRANRTVTARGTTIQFVFPSGVFIYTDDGKVTAFQD